MLPQLLERSTGLSENAVHHQSFGESLLNYSNPPICGLIESFKQCKSICELLSKYIAFYNSYRDETHYTKYVTYTSKTKTMLLEIVKKSLFELNIPFEVISDDDGVFIFPQGAKELDDALVSEPLEWLSSYPNCRETFVIALKQYSDGTYIRDVADNLRKALEAFFQEFLCNTKNLETNKNDICKYLGEHSVDSGIAGLYQPLINAYKSINDRIVKHNDGVDKKLLEFLLYQTGLLIRMVISVKKAEETPNAD